MDKDRLSEMRETYEVYGTEFPTSPNIPHVGITEDLRKYIQKSQDLAKELSTAIAVTDEPLVLRELRWMQEALADLALSLFVQNPDAVDRSLSDLTYAVDHARLTFGLENYNTEEV